MSNSMSMAITPMNFLAGSEALGYLNEGWALDQAPHGSPERSFRSRVTFERPFTDIPLVHLGIAGFDVANQDSARVTSRVENVSPEGFDIVLGTWLHTRVWRVDVNWLAIGA
jgi:H-type lectin domain